MSGAWKFAVLAALSTAISTATAQTDTEDPARQAIARSVEAMGGDAYMQVRAIASTGRLFNFSKGRKSFARFSDWTVYNPVKWRFQLGEGKRRFVQIYNLEMGKAWTLEGKSTIEEVPEKDIEDFRKTVREDLDILLRNRIDEEGMNLYYFGPEDVAGSGEFEAVEFLDSTNLSIVVFFELKTGLPSKLETHFTDDVGVRHKREQEMYNWHVFNGVRVPLRYDVLTDGEISSQRFIETLEVNPVLDPMLFEEPVPEAK